MSNEALEQRLERIENMLTEILGKKRNPELNDYISIDRASELSKLSAKTIRNYMSSGKLAIPTRKEGQKILISESHFGAWVADRVFINRI